ncbi:MAG: sigma-54-dependent Fis family transcriptional regulator [Gammaproteobacteria bacterium]|nr:sigma-54-dependent Fis family transcriptional regulator [Gammaproteobacteria bacterium]
MSAGDPVLIVEDDAELRDALAQTLAVSGCEVVTATDGSEALAAMQDQRFSVVVTDFQMQPMDGHALLCRIRERHPDMPVLLMTGHGSIERAVRAMRDGASDYLVKPFEISELLTRIERLSAPRTLDDGLVAEDPLTQSVLALASRVAAADATVLLCGESGTGKEVFARFIHRESSRASGPFVAINCAAIPENMLEAVLFGHEKGAFTGAHTSRTGKFEQAQGGTLLLDEVSEMDLGLQAKLLRVLQERELERVGSERSISLDVRVLATTNRDLHECVREGTFREDLFYRLSVFPLALPPLRDRVKDILPLARHFLAGECKDKRAMPSLNDKAIEKLQSYSWPGNVRELANLMQRALILGSGDQIREQDLRFEQGLGAVMNDRSDPQPEGLQEGLKSSETRMIMEALREGGSRKRAAELLGISPRTLRYKIARLREAGTEVPGGNSMSTA